MVRSGFQSPDHTRTGHSKEYRSTAYLLTKKQSAVNAWAIVTGFKRQTATI